MSNPGLGCVERSETHHSAGPFRGAFRAFALCAPYVIALLLLCAPALAHTRSESFSVWQVQGRELIGSVQVDAHRATQLARSPQEASALPALFARHVGEAVRASQNGAACPASAPTPLAAATGQLRTEIVLTCQTPLGERAATVEIRLLRTESPGHVHYVRLDQPGGESREAVLAGSRSRFEIGGPAKDAPSGFGRLFLIGLEHVLSGPDHLAFLLALVMLAGRPWSAALAATGFTLGHSLTLGLVAFGWLAPDTAAIEALIGFTIAFTAALVLAGEGRDNSVDRRLVLLAAAATAALPLLDVAAPHWPVYAGAGLFALGFGLAGNGASVRLALVIATAFGLVHGAGFAGGLLDLELPRERLLGALVAFNLGVEAAQIAVLAACAALATAGAQLPEGWSMRAREVTAALLVGLGIYWLVERSLGV